MIIYIKNVDELSNTNNQATVPIVWMWNNLVDGNVGWTAAAYFSNFWVYLVVSVGEFVTWFFYIFGDPEYFSWWSKNVSYYGVMVGGLLPVLFASLQLGLEPHQGGLAGNESKEFGFNSVFVIAVGLAVWF